MGRRHIINKKLILFIHGLGGSEETWGAFPTLISADKDSNAFDVAFFEYRTSLFHRKSDVFMPQNLFAKFALLFSLHISQRQLPKIQHIAKQLQSKIEDYYKDYEDIYFITHSMGGLVARKYLSNMIKAKEDLKVKKLMLYAVPNNGTNWAKFASIYPHTQIEQLNEMNDFLELLNEEMDIIQFDQHIESLYIVGDEDEVVSRHSAKSYHGNSSVKYLDKGHIDIVKPKDREDHSYKVFSNFILQEEMPLALPGGKQVLLSYNAKQSDFVKEVFGSLLTFKPLMVLYYQDFMSIVQEKCYIKEQAFEIFGEHMYEIDIPSAKDDKTYFYYLAKACGMSLKIDSADGWRDALKVKLEDKSRLLLLISEVDNGEKELNKLLGNAIRALQTSFPNLFVLFIGRKKLAYMVHGENELSTLNGAIELFFPTSERYLPKEKVLEILEQFKEDCDLLCSDIRVEWSVYPSIEIIRRLFWRNLLKKEEDIFVWYDEEIEALAKDVCGCKDV